MRIVVALGGNALLERGEPPESEIQEKHIRKAVTALAPLAREHELVITHGNGPQVGLLALESAGDPALAHPYPLDVLGAQTQGMIGYWLVQALEGTGVIVVCSGGGGVPVVRTEAGRLRGVEAVVDKDLTAALLAQGLGADALLLLTDVEAVKDGFGTPHAQPIHWASPGDLRTRSFPAGSMGPKVEAVCRFVEATGKMAGIGQLADAGALLRRDAGTTVTPG
jgi:carbamate kinase